MDARKRAGWLVVAIAAAAGGAWALRPPGAPNDRPRTEDAGTTAPSRPQAPPTEPPVVLSQAPATAPVPLARPEHLPTPDPATDAAAREGFWTEKSGDGHTKSGEYIGGLKEGRWTEFYENGRKAGETNFVHGIPNGLEIGWDPEGVKIFERPFRDGVLDGTVVITYPDGHRITEEWRHGTRVDVGASPFPAADAPPP